MAIKIECDMCGRLIGELTDIESEGLVFDGYTVKFKDASPSWNMSSGIGDYEGTYCLCKECTDRLAKKASGWYDGEV